MSNQLNPKNEKQHLSRQATTVAQRHDEETLELRKFLNSPLFADLVSVVVATTYSRLPQRSPESHIQLANLAARDAINQFLQDLHEEVNKPNQGPQTETYE